MFMEPQQHNWVRSSSFSALPSNAVVGAYDSDGSPIYVGRAFHEGDNMPAKVIPRKRCALISWNGAEYTKSTYDVLIGQDYAWVQCSGGSVPPNAVYTGKTRTGEPLYGGRGLHANSLSVGKIHLSHGCMFIPFHGQEVRIKVYEVLIYERRDNRVTFAYKYTPPGTTATGHDKGNCRVYVGRSLHEEHNWVQSSSYSVLPPGAVVGGRDCDGAPIYVGRAFHEGDNMPAKVIPKKRCAFISWDGAEYTKTGYDVLVGQGYAWVSSSGGSVPSNAVSSGITKTGELLYVGRGHHSNSLTVGKIHPSHGCLYIPFGGKEVCIKTYEVLVYERLDNRVTSTSIYTPPAGHANSRRVGWALPEEGEC